LLIGLTPREFEQAESFLKQAIALDERSAEVKSLWDTLQRCRPKPGEGPYPILRELCW
jgi:hypothetical protein